MTVAGSSLRFVLFDGYDLTTTEGYLTEFNPVGVERTFQDLRGPQSAWPVLQLVGYTVVDDLSFLLWADSAIQALLDELHGVTPADRESEKIVIYGWTGGNVIGQKCECFRGYLMKPEPKTPTGALTQFAVTVKVTQEFSHALIVHELSAETADGDTEADKIDNTGASAAGGIGWCMFTAFVLDTATNLIPRIVDSADDIAYGALITFTAVTALKAVERLTVAGEVLQYVASDWTWTGGAGGSSSGTFIIAFERL